MKLLLIIAIALTSIACTKTHPAFSEYNPDSLYCCPPLDAPTIRSAKRVMDQLIIVDETGHRYTIDLSTGQSDYILADCSGFKWNCKEWPLRFYRNVTKDGCEEFVLYFGRRYDLNDVWLKRAERKNLEEIELIRKTFGE